MTFSDFIIGMTPCEYQSTVELLLRFFGFEIGDKVRYRNQDWEITGTCVASQYGKPINALEVVIAKYECKGDLLVQKKNKHLVFPKDLNKIQKEQTKGGK